MPKLIVLEFMSLDGVIQAPGGPQEDISGGFKFGGWTAPYFDDFAGEIMSQQMREPFSLLLGRKTFDIWEGYWPKHEAMWPGINKATKYVVSKTRASSDWKNTIFLTGDTVEAIKKLKTGESPDIQVYGSSNLIQTLLKHDLVDELWLKIFPITLGNGKRLFAGGAIPAAFKLIDAQVSPTGVIFANYARAGEVKTGSMAD